VRQAEQACGSDGISIKEGAQSHSFAVVQLHEGEGEFGFEAGDPKGRVIELDFLFVIAMGRVIAAQDIDGAVGDGCEDGFTIGGGAQGRIHFEVRVVRGPRREICVIRARAEDGAAVLGPELLAAGDSGIGEGKMMGTGLTGNGHSAFFCFAQQFHAAGQDLWRAGGLRDLRRRSTAPTPRRP